MSVVWEPGSCIGIATGHEVTEESGFSPQQDARNCCIQQSLTSAGAQTPSPGTKQQGNEADDSSRSSTKDESSYSTHPGCNLAHHLLIPRGFGALLCDSSSKRVLCSKRTLQMHALHFSRSIYLSWRIIYYRLAYKINVNNISQQDTLHIVRSIVWLANHAHTALMTSRINKANQPWGHLQV
jgi:hypothetical protein